MNKLFKIYKWFYPIGILIMFSAFLFDPLWALIPFTIALGIMGFAAYLYETSGDAKKDKLEIIKQEVEIALLEAKNKEIADKIIALKNGHK